MFIGGQSPQYIYRDRPSFGLRDTDGHSNGTHIICSFVRTLVPQADSVADRDQADRKKFVNLKEPHFTYPIYADQDLMTPQGIVLIEKKTFETIHLGMRVPAQEIPIVNNHPINFERRIWPKSHPRAASFLAKIHGNFKIFFGDL